LGLTSISLLPLSSSLPDDDAVVTLAEHEVWRGSPLEISCSPAANRLVVWPAEGEAVPYPITGDGTSMTLATAELPVGEIVVVAELTDGTSYALRGMIRAERQPPRAASTRTRTRP